jgi:hypothetical protein
MGTRLELQALLLTCAANVYFQPPESLKLTYPCIIYKRDSAKTIFADNEPYKHTKRYLITVIDPDPDSDIPDKVAALPKCVYDRFFPADKLNHDTFKIFF